MCQLLNYKLSKLGNYIGSACSSFDFRFVTTKEVSLTLKNLNWIKPSGFSDIPSWALKDGFFITDQINLLFNQSLAERKFPEDLNKALNT